MSTNTKHEVVYINLDDAVTETRNGVAERGRQFDLSLLPISNLSEIGQYSPRYPQEYAVHTHRFGRKLELPSTIAIKHQIRKLMFEDSVEKAEAGARAEAIRGQLREEIRSLVQSGRR